MEELPAKPPFPPSAPHSRNRPRFHGERVARGGEHLHAGGGGAREGEVVSRVPRTGAGREGGFHREAQDFQRARGLRRGCGALVEDRRVRGKFQEEGRGAARDGHPGVQIRQFSRGLGVFFQSLTCPYCQQAKSALRAAGFVPKVVNVNSSLREELLALTGKTSVPSVWIGNKYIGGCNDGAESWMGTIPNIQNGNIKKWIEVRISRAYFVSSGKEIVFCRQRNHHRFNQRPSTIDRS